MGFSLEICNSKLLIFTLLIDILISSLNRQGYTTSFNEETYEITFGGPMMRVGFLEDEVEKSEKSENNIN